MILRLLHTWLRFVSKILPPDVRASWLDEWTGELSGWTRARATSGAGAMSLRAFWRVALALPDALDVRRHHVAERRAGRSKQKDFGALTDLRRDARQAVRAFARQPAFTATAMVTLALGIGANTMIFSVVNAVVLRPLPFPEPGRLVSIWPTLSMSKKNFHLIERHTTSYESMAVWGFNRQVVTGEEQAEPLNGPEVSAAFFDVLGITPLRGRWFIEGEDRQGFEDVVVVSHGLWQRRFGGDPNLVGSTISLGEQEVTVIGILPVEADVIQRGADLVYPTLMDPHLENYDAFYLNGIGRLRPGVTVEQADQELRRVIESLRDEQGWADDFGRNASVIPLREHIVGDARTYLWILLGAVAFILLTAIANVANLMLARTVSRQRDIMLRRALGASPWRLVRQSLTETTILAVGGGVVGVAVAYTGLSALVSVLPPETPRLSTISIDSTVLVVSLAVVLVTGWIVGVFPAFHIVRGGAHTAFRGVGAGTSRARHLARRALVSFELATAIVLLAGAGILLKSFRSMTQVDPGFRPDGVLTFVTEPGSSRPDAPESAAPYYRAIEQRLRSVPGIEQVAQVHQIPVAMTGWSMGVYPVEAPPAAGETPLIPQWRPISPTYFETIGMRLVAGRAFTDADEPGTERVAIVNESLAQQFWPDADPIGRRLVVRGEGSDPMTVVGVVADARITDLLRPGPMTVYRPYPQAAERLYGFGFRQRAFVLRTSGNPEALVETVKRAVADVDRDLAVFSVQSMNAIVSESLAEPRVVAFLIAGLAGVAITLGAVGVYGVMSFLVSERAREMSIRLALGASGARVVGSVVADATVVASVGALIGLALAAGLVRLLENFTFGVTANEPLVFGLVAVTLLSVAILASWFPARRAGSADPMDALRGE